MKSKVLLLSVLPLLMLAIVTCHQVLFTAPPGSNIFCQENPHVIAAFNGVSTISCLLTEPTGFPVADGTTVQFFTNLGRVPEQGRTNDGVVRVNLTADGRSGTATVVAISGGASSGGGTTPTTGGGSSTTTIVGSPGRGLAASSASSASAASASSALMAQDSVDVVIGNPNAQSLRVVAFPPRLTDSRTSQITANVFDGQGNPVAGVPVIFEVLSSSAIGSPTPVPVGTPTPAPGTQPIYEHMDSQGQPVFTDSNGQAHDVMRTRYPRDAAPREVIVRASVAFDDAIADEVRIFVN
jgi:hypothetical protein